MKSFKKILKSDTKTVIYLKNKAKRRLDLTMKSPQQQAGANFSEITPQDISIKKMEKGVIPEEVMPRQKYSNSFKYFCPMNSDMEHCKSSPNQKQHVIGVRVRLD